MVALSAETPAIPRVFGRVEVRFERVRFDVGTRQWEASAAIVRCLDEAVLPTFVALATDASARLPTTGCSASTVLEVLDSWEALFRRLRHLSAEEELGLWAELRLLSLARSPQEAVLAWTGPDDENVDFHGGGVALECKASTRQLVHHFSASQAGRPRGDVPSYVASLWVGHDSSAGESLPDLVMRVTSRLPESSEFERKLAQAGYSHSDAGLYTTRFVLLEAPLVFPTDSIPQVRQLDPGVIRVRYEARLERHRALPQEDAARLIRGLGSA